MPHVSIDVIVVEKGEMDSPTPTEGVDTSKYAHIARLPPGKTVLMPNVDSCLGIVIELEDNSRVVAHLGMFDMGEPETALSAQMDAIMSELKSPPRSVTYIGDSDTWDVKALTSRLIRLNEDIDVDAAHFVSGYEASDVVIRGAEIAVTPKSAKSKDIGSPKSFGEEAEDSRSASPDGGGFKV